MHTLRLLPVPLGVWHHLPQRPLVYLAVAARAQARTGRFMERLPETPKKQGSCEHFSLILLCFPLKPRTQNPRTRRGFPCSTLELGRLVPVLIVKCFGTALVKRLVQICLLTNGKRRFRPFWAVKLPHSHTQKVSNGFCTSCTNCVRTFCIFLHGSLLDFVSFLSVGA